MRSTKFILLFLGLSLIAACSKKYNCDCVLTTTDTNGIETISTTTYVIKNTRVKAINQCKTLDDKEDYICDITN